MRRITLALLGVVAIFALMHFAPSILSIGERPSPSAQPTIQTAPTTSNPTRYAWWCGLDGQNQPLVIVDEKGVWLQAIPINNPNYPATALIPTDLVTRRDCRAMNINLEKVRNGEYPVEKQSIVVAGLSTLEGDMAKSFRYLAGFICMGLALLATLVALIIWSYSSSNQERIKKKVRAFVLWAGSLEPPQITRPAWFKKPQFQFTLPKMPSVPTRQPRATAFTAPVIEVPQAYVAPIQTPPTDPRDVYFQRLLNLAEKRPNVQHRTLKWFSEIMEAFGIEEAAERQLFRDYLSTKGYPLKEDAEPKSTNRTKPSTIIVTPPPAPAAVVSPSPPPAPPEEPSPAPPVSSREAAAEVDPNYLKYLRDTFRAALLDAYQTRGTSTYGQMSKAVLSRKTYDLHPDEIEDLMGFLRRNKLVDNSGKLQRVHDAIMAIWIMPENFTPTHKTFPKSTTDSDTD